jgi:hypothetical protein
MERWAISHDALDAAIAAVRKVERDVPFKGFGLDAICPGGCRCDRCTGLL